MRRTRQGEHTSIPVQGFGWSLFPQHIAQLLWCIRLIGDAQPDGKTIDHNLIASASLTNQATSQSCLVPPSLPLLSWWVPLALGLLLPLSLPSLHCWFPLSLNNAHPVTLSTPSHLIPGPSTCTYYNIDKYMFMLMYNLHVLSVTDPDCYSSVATTLWIFIRWLVMNIHEYSNPLCCGAIPGMATTPSAHQDKVWVFWKDISLH